MPADSEGEPGERVEDALLQAAVGGNVIAIELWLDRNGPPPFPPVTPRPVRRAALVQLNKHPRLKPR